MNIPQFDYSFTHGWTFPLFPAFADKKNKAAIHIHSSLYGCVLSFLLNKYTEVE